jgi:hypothetical protein
MKITAMQWLAATTLLLITTVIFSLMNLEFGWVFYTSCLGQLVLIVAVYKVLTDDYQTDKTFRDFYEDRPDLGRNE